VVWHVGASAFHRIRDERPQLVLLDINLINPGRGWNTLDALPLHPKTRHIPVILCATDMRLIEAKADLLCELNCQSWRSHSRSKRSRSGLQRRLGHHLNVDVNC